MRQQEHSLGTAPIGGLIGALFLVLLLNTAAPAPAHARVLYEPSGASASGNSTPDATPTTQPATDASKAKDKGHGGGDPKNVVEVRNQTDQRLRVRGNVQLNQLSAETIGALNYAYAYSSCVSCQSFAVALQINLYPNTASTVAPQNAAIAVNDHCTGCTTVARAIQYDYPEDDPTRIPDRIADLVGQMNKTLDKIQKDPAITVTQAQAQIDAVTSQFQDLATYLHDQQQTDTASVSPNAPTPFPTAMATPAGTAVSMTPTATAGTVTPTVTASPVSTPSPTAAPTDIATPTGTLAPTAVASPAASSTALPSVTAGQ